MNRIEPFVEGSLAEETAEEMELEAIAQGDRDEVDAVRDGNADISMQCENGHNAMVVPFPHRMTETVNPKFLMIFLALVSLWFALV